MSSIANVLVAAALTMAVGGAVVATSVADSSEPPRVGDPVIIEPDGQGPPPTSGAAGPDTRAPATSPASTDSGDPKALDDDRDDDPGDHGGAGTGTIDDDGVDEVFPSPRTLDDDADDRGGDDGDDGGDDTGGGD